MGEKLKTVGNVAEKMVTASKVIQYSSAASVACLIPVYFITGALGVSLAALTVISLVVLAGLAGIISGLVLKGGFSLLHKFANKDKNQEKTYVETYNEESKGNDGIVNQGFN